MSNMILIEEATVQCAVEALKAVRRNMLDNAPHLSGKVWGLAERAITAIDEALAAPQPALAEQNPVVWRWKNKLGEVITAWLEYKPNEAECVREQVTNEGGTIEYAYADLPQRQPLTRQQINKMDEGCDFSGNIYEITRAVEIEHGIGTKP
jgi:hypothetical protein